MSDSKKKFLTTTQTHQLPIEKFNPWSELIMRCNAAYFHALTKVCQNASNPQAVNFGVLINNGMEWKWNGNGMEMEKTFI